MKRRTCFEFFQIVSLKNCNFFINKYQKHAINLYFHNPFEQLHLEIDKRRILFKNNPFVSAKVNASLQNSDIYLSIFFSKIVKTTNNGITPNLHDAILCSQLNHNIAFIQINHKVHICVHINTANLPNRYRMRHPNGKHDKTIPFRPNRLSIGCVSPLCGQNTKINVCDYHLYDILK